MSNTPRTIAADLRGRTDLAIEAMNMEREIAALKSRLETAEKERDELNEKLATALRVDLAEYNQILLEANAQWQRNFEAANARVTALEHQLASAHETHDTILAALNGEEVNTDGNEAATRAREMFLKGVQRLWRPIESAPLPSKDEYKPYVLAVDAKKRMAVGYFIKYAAGELGFTSAKAIAAPVKWMPLPTAPQ